MRIDFDYEENLKKTFNHYGLEAQLGQLSEECNELATAAHHYQRAIKKDKTTNLSVILGQNMNEQAVRNELVSEIADVINLVNQITGALKIAADVNETCKEKMVRQVKRIREESGKDNMSAIVDAGLMMANEYSNLVDRLAGFVKTSKFIHPFSAEALLRDAIAMSQFRIATWRKVLDDNKEK